MLKFIYQKSEIIFQVAIIILIIIPLLYLSIYNHPHADDFELIQNVKNKNPFQIVYDFYFKWSGSYIGVFIQSIFQPTTIGGFKIVPFFIILLYIGSFYYIIHIFFAKQLSWKEKLGGTLIGFALFFSKMNSPAETLYWVMSALAYQTSYLLYIVLIGIMITWLRGNYIMQNEQFHKVLLVIFTLLTTGHTANISLLTVASCLVLVIYTYLYHHQLKFFAWVLLGISLIGFAIFFFAPGNFARIGFSSHKKDLWLSLIVSAKMYFSYLTYWFSNGFFILTTFLFLFLIIEKKVMTTTKIPFFIPFILVFGVTYSFLFLPYYTVGYVSARHVDMGYLFFIIGWFISIYYLVSDLTNRNIIFAIPSSSYIRIACWIGVILLIFSIPQSNQRRLLEDVFKGTAQKFDIEMNNRYQEVINKKTQGEKYIVLDSLQNQPFTIFQQDMSISPRHWHNKGFSAYFGIDSVIAKGGVPLPKR
jgi:hypothetical protein